MLQMSHLIALASLVFTCLSAGAGNTPCSGSKGGIDHCAGATFICHDGSVSASTRNCTAYTGSAKSADMGRAALAPQPAATDANVTVAASSGDDCSCRSHKYCTGPRGGQYCMTDAGSKSYRRH